jgi:hypothetical protein
MHSCPSQTLKDTDKKSRNSMKVIKNSMKVAQTFWIKICIKCQTTQTLSCLGLGKAIGKTAANDERRQVLNPRVTWDGSIDHLRPSGTMWWVIMDRVVLAIFLIQTFKQHTWKEEQTVL